MECREAQGFIRFPIPQGEENPSRVGAVLMEVGLYAHDSGSLPSIQWVHEHCEVDHIEAKRILDVYGESLIFANVTMRDLPDDEWEALVKEKGGKNV